MIVADRAGGATRAKRARETGKTLAKAALFKTSNPRIQPNATLSPDLAAMVAPIASESIPSTARTQPIAIFVISVGSRCFFDQSRQKMTEINRKLTDTIESSDMSHVVNTSNLKK